MRSDLPSGTVTFLFTDVKGSTALLHTLGDRDYGRALAEHRRVLREAFAVGGGVEVDTQGDAFFVAFPTAAAALAAAAQVTGRLKGDETAARRELEDALAAAEDGGVPASYVSTVELTLGRLLTSSGEVAAGRKRLEASLARATAVGDEWAAEQARSALRDSDTGLA